MATSHFKPALFKFLRELKKNNNREWFNDNKKRYEQDVKEPMLDFIVDFAPRLKKISPNFVADPRKSMFRIYRDIRFSKDKSPYKTYASAQFRHKRGKDVHAPGFYLHLEPTGVFAAVGLWHPDGPTLKKIRDGIVKSPANWKKAVTAKSFKSTYQRAGDVLKRPPRGYDADHPYIEDLKYKDFIATCELKQSDVTKGDFLGKYTKKCEAGAPFMKWLTKAVGVKY